MFERTAMLPLLYDAHDFGISLFDDRLNLIADAPGVPEFVGSLDFALAAIVDHFHRERRLQPDDVVISTHPFLTGNHPPDASMIVPAFADGRAGRLLRAEGAYGRPRRERHLSDVTR